MSTWTTNALINKHGYRVLVQVAEIVIGPLC